jgi:hypothetical protein
MKYEKNHIGEYYNNYIYIIFFLKLNEISV